MEWQGRLEELWRLARSTQTEHPALSRAYVQHIVRVAESRPDELGLPPSFFLGACAACGTLFVPGANVRVREGARRSVRRRRGARVVLAARGRGTDGRQLRYACLACGTVTILPIAVGERTPETAVSASLFSPAGAPKTASPEEARRRAELQKVLQRAGNAQLASFLRKR